MRSIDQIDRERELPQLLAERYWLTHVKLSAKPISILPGRLRLIPALKR